jgi:uncharacterized membrane protein
MLSLLQENLQPILAAPGEGVIEGSVVSAVQWLRLAVETVGALIIAFGVGVAALQFVRALVTRRTESYNGIRLTLARHLALALEFQLAADILSTAVAPSWEQIGKLGAIAVIRTGLNYFLMREMEVERTGEAGREAKGDDS